MVYIVVNVVNKASYMYRETKESLKQYQNK